MFQPKKLLPMLIVVSIFQAPAAIAQSQSSLADDHIPTQAPTVPTDFYGSGDAKLPSWASGNRHGQSAGTQSTAGPQHKALKWHSSDTSGDSIQNWGQTNSNARAPQDSFAVGKPGQQNNSFDVGPRFTAREKNLGISTASQPMLTRQDMCKLKKNNHLLDRLEEYKGLKRKMAEDWARAHNVKMPNQR